MLLALAGCVAPAGTVPPEATLTPTSTVARDPAYPGPRPMPAADGEPMLWPTATLRTEPAEGVTVTRYGLVDATGTRVVPARYDQLTYCPDESGRAEVILAASGEDASDVLSLTGEVVASLPTRFPQCAGQDQVVIREPIEPELGRWRTGLVSLPTGEVTLPLAERSITAIDATTVNVSEPAGEYFLALDTGEQTPHPGWMLDAVLEAGAPGVPASARTRDEVANGETGRVGFVGRSGSWLIPPELEWASGFRSGHAVIEREGRFTFLDAGLRRVGGEWETVEPVEVARGSGFELVGYVVAGDGKQGLLGPDLRAIVQPGAATVECPWQADGACAVVAPDGTADLVLLPEGTVSQMPDGFSQVLSRGFVADRVEGTAQAQRVLSLTTGATLVLPEPSSCVGVGVAWVSCDPETEVLAPVVVNTDGAKSAFREITAVPDPDPAAGIAYYWATSGRYQGFVDAAGAWLFRESRFTQLED